MHKNSLFKVSATVLTIGVLTALTGPFLTPYPNILQMWLMAGIPLGLFGLMVACMQD